MTNFQVIDISKYSVKKLNCKFHVSQILVGVHIACNN